MIEHNHSLNDVNVIGRCITYGQFLCQECGFKDEDQYFCKKCRPNRNKFLKFIFGDVFFIICFIPFVLSITSGLTNTTANWEGFTWWRNFINVFGLIFLIIAILLIIFRKKISVKLRLK